MAASKQLRWYAPKECAENSIQLGLYAIASQSPYSNTSIYFEDLYSKIKSELNTEITHDGISTMEIIEQLSSSFQLNSFFDEDHIAASIAGRMQDQLQDDPVILIQVEDEDALRIAEEQAESPQAIAYQSVCEF